MGDAPTSKKKALTLEGDASGRDLDALIRVDLNYLVGRIVQSAGRDEWGRALGRPPFRPAARKPRFFDPFPTLNVEQLE